MARRWDSGYGKPQDPLPKDTYNVTDEEKAYWNGKQDRLVYDPVPTEDSINAVEGIVFSYKGKVMKMTGSFAPLNRILNLRFNV